MVSIHSEGSSIYSLGVNYLPTEDRISTHWASNVLFLGVKHPPTGGQKSNSPYWGQISTHCGSNMRSWGSNIHSLEFKYSPNGVQIFTHWESNIHSMGVKCPSPEGQIFTQKGSNIHPVEQNVHSQGVRHLPTENRIFTYCGSNVQPRRVKYPLTGSQISIS